jgi:transketolase
MEIEIKDLNVFATKIRIETLKSLSKIGRGHIGGSMSIAELLAVLYGEIMKIDPANPDWDQRDWFVLSKGHSGPALYAALALRGYFSTKELLTINQPETRLPSHCDRNKTPGVDMSTGSLGQGMSTGIGIALAHKIKKTPNYTYIVLGDGECAEGQIWEGALFANQQKLDHVIAFIDKNSKQLDGYTKDICDLGDIAKKFEEFGWDTQEIDGHDVEAIKNAILQAKTSNCPSMIVLNTIKGRDCLFAENTLYNHHMEFTPEQYNEAIECLESNLKTIGKKAQI